MGHDIHFLQRLERVSVPQADLALDLYRDAELVIYILGRASLPDGADRVALALDNRPDGPHIIVTRKGAFVTCLGPGMSTGDRPVISRAHIDMCRQALSNVRKADDEGTLVDAYSRMLRNGRSMSREDFRLLAALYPLLESEFLNATIDFYKYIVRIRDTFRRSRYRHMTPENREYLESYWQCTWSVGHIAMLHGTHIHQALDRLEPKLTKGLDSVLLYLTWPTSMTMSAPLVLRGVWAMARAGRRALPFHKRSFEQPGSFEEHIHSTLTLAAMGIRHRRLRAEVQKVLARRTGPLLDPSCDAPLCRVARRLVEMCANNLAGEGADMLEAYRVNGANLVVEICKKYIPEDNPLRFERADDVPDDLIYTLPPLFYEDLFVGTNLLQIPPLILQWLAQADAESLYLPAKYMPTYEVRWKPEETFRLLESNRRFYGRYEPLRKESEVGRNAPCPCGSGKKYKRCCGA